MVCVSVFVIFVCLLCVSICAFEVCMCPCVCVCMFELCVSKYLCVFLVSMYVSEVHVCISGVCVCLCVCLCSGCVCLRFMSVCVCFEVCGGGVSVVCQCVCVCALSVCIAELCVCVCVNAYGVCVYVCIIKCQFLSNIHKQHIEQYNPFHIFYISFPLSFSPNSLSPINITCNLFNYYLPVFPAIKM